MASDIRKPLRLKRTNPITTTKEGIMTYKFTITSENNIKITAPTEEDAWDRLQEVINVDPNNLDIECTCLGDE